MTKWLNLRTLIFLAGAGGAIAKAVELAQKDGGVTVAHLIGVGCVALAAFAMKWPGDVTASDAKEIEARALRQSIAPPPGYDPKQEDEHGP